jgi:GNAT superfamily N-acetyltransferase
VVGVRVASPDDYDRVIAVVDEWFGRPVSSSLPRLFLDLFWATSTVADDDQGLAGFLVAFVSPSQPRLGYLHFVGIRPDRRRTGLARTLYEGFASYAQGQRCRELRAITAPGNRESIRFHEHLGFTATAPVANFNGPGRAMVIFRRDLSGDLDGALLP